MNSCFKAYWRYNLKCWIIHHYEHVNCAAMWILIVMTYYRQFEKQVVPKSSVTPFLIFFYADWCFPCLQAVPHCRKIIDNLEPLGINFVTVHSANDLNLVRKLSIHTLPCLVLLIDGNSYVFKDSISSLSRLIGE